MGTTHSDLTSAYWILGSIYDRFLLTILIVGIIHSKVCRNFTFLKAWNGKIILPFCTKGHVQKIELRWSWCRTCENLKNDEVNKVENWQKLTPGLNPNHMHIFKPWKKDVQSCLQISMKLYKELRLQGTHCLYTFIQSEVRKWQSSQSGKSDKNYFKDYIQTICTSPDHGENMCKVSKRSA